MIDAAQKPTPPMLAGKLPLIGHGLKFHKDRTALFQKGFAQHGRAFAIRLGPANAAVLIGPEYHGIFWKETDKRLDMSESYRMLKPIVGENIFVGSHDDYLRQRPILYAPFTREKMAVYLKVMQEEIQAFADGLGQEGRFEVVEAMNQLVQQVAGRALLGDDFIAKIGKEFWENYAVIGKSLDPILPPNLPLPKFIRRNKARKKLQAILEPLITERRANPEQFDDFFQDIIAQEGSDGRPATVEELTGILIGLMFAGHETTAGQSAWTLIQLLQHPAYLDKVQTEIAEKFPYGRQLDARGMVQLKHTKWAVEETSRMKPSADILMRMTDADLDIGDYVIPKGWLVFVSGDVAQKLPEIFSEPEKYDPMRFAPERAEHKAERNAIMSFGGGMHKCVGMNFALNEMILITAQLFQQFEMTLETAQPEVSRSMGASRPSETWVRYRRKKLEKLVPKAVVEEAVAAGCPHMLAAQARERAMQG